jgi:hypothetical protein
LLKMSMLFIWLLLNFWASTHKWCQTHLSHFFREYVLKAECFFVYIEIYISDLRDANQWPVACRNTYLHRYIFDGAKFSKVDVGRSQIPIATISDLVNS